MEHLKAAKAQVVEKTEIYAKRAKIFADDFKNRSMTAAKDPKVQTTVGSAAGGTILLGICGGALGVATGGIAGAAVGLPFVLFTFGLSVPISAVIGAGVAGSTGLVGGGATGCATGGTLGYTLFTWRKEIRDAANRVLAGLKDAKASCYARASSVFADSTAHFLTIRSLVVAQILKMTTITKEKVYAVTDAGVKVAKDPKAQATAAGATVGGVALGGAAGAIGLAGGAVVGGVVGIVPALFTFGLSIPIFAAVGGGAGLCLGTAVGSTTGAVGGGAVGYGVYGRRFEIEEGALKCRKYTAEKVGDAKAFITSKSMSVQSAQGKAPAPEIVKKNRPVGA